MAAGGESEPNLTPFIDLFSVLTCFLLMTSAWIHLESIGVKMGPVTSAPETQAPSTPPPPKKLTLSVEINEQNIVITKNDSKLEFEWNPLSLENTLGEMEKELSQIKQEFAEETIDVTLTSKGRVYYGDLIKVYDGIILSGWESVAISPY